MALLCHGKNPEEIAALYDTSASSGLTPKEAKKRLRYFGKNLLYNTSEPDAVGLVLRLILSPSSLMFFTTAVACSALRTGGALLSALLWAAATVLLSILSIASARVLCAVRALGIPRARVVRDGKPRLIDSRSLVPGDLILLTEGDVVSADCRLIYAEELKVREPIGTDDFRLAEKSPAACPEAIAPGEMSNMLFASSTVTRGGGRAIVTATGSDTLVLGDNGGAPLPLRGRQIFRFAEQTQKTGKILSLVACVALFLFSVVLIVAAPRSPLDYFLAAASAVLFWISGAFGIFTTLAVSSSVGAASSRRGCRALIKNIGALDPLCDCDTLICGETFAEPFLGTLPGEAAAYGLRVFITVHPESATRLAEACGAVLCASPADAAELSGNAPVCVVCRGPADRAKLAALLSTAGHVCASVASKAGHIGMFNASAVSFCCSALSLSFDKVTDVTLEDIDRTAGNEAMMKNSDVLCEPTDRSALGTFGEARGAAHRLSEMEGFAVSSAVAMLLTLPLTLAESAFVLPSVPSVLCAFPVLFSAMLALAVSGGPATTAPSPAQRRSQIAFGTAGAALWLLLLFAVRIFSEQLGVPVGEAFRPYCSASLMLFLAFSAAFFRFGERQRQSPLLVLPLVFSASLLVLSAFWTQAGNLLCPGLDRYVLLLAAVPALVSAGLTAFNRTVYNKHQNH